MANDKNFKIKNGLLAGRYLLSSGTAASGSEGYYFAGASYDSKSFDVGTQEANPRDIFFKPDGTKMYIVGNNSDTVHQYTLSTAWDVSTVSYDSVSFSVAQDTFPASIAFKTDGTKMYIAGNTSDTIYQYTLSTAWDLSTASYNSVSFSDSNFGIFPNGVSFKPDGTKMYINNYFGNSVRQWTLSTAWDISTASYDSVSYSVGTEPIGATFKDDGTGFLVILNNGAGIHQHNLSTAWDLSTASSPSISFTPTEDIQPYGLTYGNSGTVLYINGNVSDTVYQYSTVSYTQTLDLSTGNTFSFTPSGATTVSFTNPPASGTAVGFTVEVVGDGSAITWPSSIKWPGGTTPTATASKELYTFITTDGGTTYYGKLAAGDIA